MIGALVIKHMESFSDSATLEHISQNVYIHYFLGYSSFTNEPPFTAPLFVLLRKRMSLELMGQINVHLARLVHTEELDAEEDSSSPLQDQHQNLPEAKEEENTTADQQPQAAEIKEVTAEDPAPRGKLLMDPTVGPQQDNSFPTDLKLLNRARLKSEQRIDTLYNPEVHGSKKPLTYRQVARKLFLNIQKK